MYDTPSTGAFDGPPPPGDTEQPKTERKTEQLRTLPPDAAPPGLRARLVWIVVVSLVLVALIGAGAAVTAAAVGASVWVGVGAAAGWLAVLLGALLAVNRAMRAVGLRIADERASRIKAEHAAWEAQWRENSGRSALDQRQRAIDEQQHATVVAVAQVNAALAESVEELGRVAVAIRRGDEPDAQVPALPATDAWPAPLTELQAGVRELMQASFGVATMTTSNQPVGVLITLARRLQPLIHRAIKELDALESQVEDPDLLNALFQLDHLVTRARRQAESIAVLGGATARQIRKPVPVYTVLRQAIAEIEHYGRVKVLRPVHGTIVGHAVTEVIHLIAELVENATAFSPPDSRVQVQVDLVPDGLSIEIDDLGLVMAADLRQRMNQLLTTPERLDVGEQLKDGRIGLIVVAAIARRYQIRVRLERNERGGNRALVVLPEKLLAEEPLRRTDLGPSALPPAPVGTVGTVTGTAVVAGTVTAPAPSVNGSGGLPRRAGDARPHGDEDTGALGLSEDDRRRLADLGRAASTGYPQTRVPADAEAPPADPGADPAELPPGDVVRPPLPRRDGQHMVPELRTAAGPEPAADTSEPGAHNPGLFASYQRGRERADTEETPPSAG
ncbi:sensor histidine kinase [Cryptosporangium sp. NPDC051539]|uniref:sensor histidine kinase n=1 Tax=Cryptosporangium sp. NPDC051539 TaxID=3363962 RepID=UPI0037AB36DB